MHFDFDVICLISGLLATLNEFLMHRSRIQHNNKSGLKPQSSERFSQEMEYHYFRKKSLILIEVSSDFLKLTNKIPYSKIREHSSILLKISGRSRQVTMPLASHMDSLEGLGSQRLRKT